MAMYTIGFTTPAAAAAAAYCDLRTTSANRVYIREIGLFLNAATASSIQLIRPATLGTVSTSIVGQLVDPADAASSASMGTAWSVAPTVSTNVPLRKITLPAAIGNGLIWTFGERELVVSVSSSLLVWNFGASAGSVLNGYMVWEE